MATDRSRRNTASAASEPRRPCRTQPPHHVPGGIACALAVAAVPLALHLPSPWPADPLPWPVGADSPTTPTSAPPATAPAPPDSTPTPADTTAHQASPTPTLPHPRTTPAHAVSTAPAFPSPTRAPFDQPSARPARTPWTLRADRLVLRALSFRGVVTVRTAAGSVRVLKFTARSVDALNLDVTAAAGRGGVVMRLRTGSTTTSTLKGRGGKGVVILYVAKLSGTLVPLSGAPLPAIRVLSITPDAVPSWLAHPATPPRTIAFTGATVSSVAQFGGDLSVIGPRLRAHAG